MLEIILSKLRLILCKLVHRNHEYVVVKDNGMTLIGECVYCGKRAEFINEEYFRDWKGN